MMSKFLLSLILVSSSISVSGIDNLKNEKIEILKEKFDFIKEKTFFILIDAEKEELSKGLKKIDDWVDTFGVQNGIAQKLIRKNSLLESTLKNKISNSEFFNILEEFYTR